MDPSAATGALELPELAVSDYIRQVLQLPGLEAQASFEANLLSKAASWDIPIPEPMCLFPPDEQKRNTSSTESQGSTVATFHARTLSSISCGSASTAPTSRSVIEDLDDLEALHKPAFSGKPRAPSFTHYDRYLAQVEPNLDQHRHQPKYNESETHGSPSSSAQSLFSVSSRRNYFGIMNGMRKIRWGKRHSLDLHRSIACTSCRQDFSKLSRQHTLPCRHSYCSQCLKQLVQQTITDESKFPPRCCTQPIPSSTLKAILPREDSREFLQVVQQFSTPWEYPNGSEEPERRCVEEDEEKGAEAEAEAEAETGQAAEEVEAAEIAQAQERLYEHSEYLRLRRDLEDQRRRFRTFVDQKKAGMRQRHAEGRRKVTAKYAEQAEKMRERHAKTAAQLEERQIEAEMEMRATLEQEEKTILIRLKHMEAYCDGLGRSPESGLPPRVVTERDLRELGQQYNLRDGMARLHESKINVLREKQARRMGDLLARQDEGLEKLEADRDRELDDLAGAAALEEDELARVFRQRELEAQRLWQVIFDILRRELEQKDGVRYGSLDAPAAWLESDEADASSLPSAEVSSDPSRQPSTQWLSLL
ncbi:hypothetical protein SODALDRAFT_285938 [Sodiomyces alkalinus F11]|uniref:RING-type domain-containing protein n=1 Tax=Sodiomyces alkalinus (strain CBS 110278 / VKM F-3762 / F11) TaxID=1314773 RepID=A0A3N2PJR3_SODAK|nr:hypothetical protein SODALDRAFT_285938 [Sodiomyces alkalinus F11]ROT34772.1 hypothetical protein SODALDRAFT_285938 [Sodiomyces alkalinus F11]